MIHILLKGHGARVFIKFRADYKSLEDFCSLFASLVGDDRVGADDEGQDGDQSDKKCDKRNVAFGGE